MKPLTIDEEEEFSDEDLEEEIEDCLYDDEE